MSKAIFDEVGVKATPLSVPDVLVGLQTGMVEVVYAPPSGAISLQWFTKVKYVTDVPLIYLAAEWRSKKMFSNKSPKLPEFVLESFGQQLDRLKTITRNEKSRRP